MTFLAVDTRAPYTREYPGSDSDKQVHYMLRWINTRGETGPPVLDATPRGMLAGRVNGEIR